MATTMTALDTHMVILKILMEHARQREIPISKLFSLSKFEALRISEDYNASTFDTDITLLENMEMIIVYQEDGRDVVKILPGGYSFAKNLKFKD